MASRGKQEQETNGHLKRQIRTATKAFEKAVDERATRRPEYILRLYVTGSSPKSLKAVYNLKRLCEEHLPGAYDLEIIDVYKNPAITREEQIIAAPTLVRKLPLPLRKFVGDLSDTEKLLVGLDVYKRLRAVSQTTDRPE